MQTILSISMTFDHILYYIEVIPDNVPLQSALQVLNISILIVHKEVFISQNHILVLEGSLVS